MKRKNRQRINRQLQLAKNEAQGDFSHLKNKKGDLLRAPIPQATLPQVSLDDDDFSSSRPTKRGVNQSGPPSSYAPSVSTHVDAYGGAGAYPDYPPDLNGVAPEYPPAMPVYDQNAWGGYPPNRTPGQHGGYDDATLYPPSEAQFATSTTHLTQAMTPADEYGAGGNGYYNAKGGYSQPAGHERRPSELSGAGLAYNDASGIEPSPVGGHAHRRSRSGQYTNAPPNDVPYSQQWPGYGPQSGAGSYDGNGQGQGNAGYGHGRQQSRGYDSGGHAM